MIAYCLFCETQRCRLISELIERVYGIHCISPEIVQRKWVRGVAEEIRHQLLPGYVFLYSDKPLSNPIRISGVIRRLGDREGMLSGENLAFARMLYEHNGVLGTIQLTEVGQLCMVTDPLWQKMRGKVIKIDRGRKRCCVEFTFDNVQRTVWLGYDLVRPIKQETTELTITEL